MESASEPTVTGNLYVNGVERSENPVMWIGPSAAWISSASDRRFNGLFKEGSGSGGTGSRLLDQVEFIPTTGPTVPVIIPARKPGSASWRHGAFRSGSRGTGPLNCQWYSTVTR